MDETGVSGTHTYAEEGTYNGSVTYHNDCGTQKVGLRGAGRRRPLSATGVPLSATAGVTVTATVATFTDADPAGTASDYTATIDWGDGTASAGTVGPAPAGASPSRGSHTYANAGTYQTSVAINDAGGATATATSTANVANPPPAPPTLLATSPPSVSDDDQRGVHGDGEPARAGDHGALRIRGGARRRQSARRSPTAR